MSKRQRLPLAKDSKGSMPATKREVVAGPQRGTDAGANGPDRSEARTA
jgi:hypothetical protein